MYDILNSLHNYFLDVDRIPVLVLAIFWSFIIGMWTNSLTGNANPLLWSVFDRLFGRIGDQMDNASRPRGDLVFRGFLFCSVIVLFSYTISVFLVEFTVAVPALVEALIVSFCLTCGSVWHVMFKIYCALHKHERIEGAYYCLSRSSRVDLNSVDDYGIARIGLSFSVFAFEKGMVAPAVWYLIGGVPFLFLYGALAFMAWRFGKYGFSRGFGVVPLALEKLMGFIPALFTGFLYAAASGVTPTAKIGKAVLVWWRRKGKAPYEQGGIALCAVSGALDVILGGPVRSLSGETLKLEWIGGEGASAKVDHLHLKRGIFLNVIALIVFILALLSIYIYAGRVF